MKTFMFTKINFILYCVLASILLIGCADAVVVNECLSENPYGFFSGLWHGVIAPISFIGSLFSDEISMYAINNIGAWYDLGFVMGSGILGGGISRSRK